MATYTNRNGTDNNDILTYDEAASSGVVYHAGRGHDSIIVTGGKVTLYTDTGNNSIMVSGGAGHVIQVAATTAEGDKVNGKEFLVINNADQVDAVLGSGSDEVILVKSNGKKSTGALSQIRGGLWGDTFTTNEGAENYQLYGEAGNDVFNIVGGSNLVFWGGAANDTFNVGGGTGIKLRGGDSADVYNIFNNANEVDIQLGYGNDVVNITGGDMHVIKANLGINEIHLLAGSLHRITSDIDQAASRKQGYTEEQIKKGEGIGYGVDKLYVDGATSIWADLGDGRDYIELYNCSGCVVNGQGWGDTLIVGNGANANMLHVGVGDDEVTVKGGKYNSIYLGSGNDLLTVNDGDRNSVWAGAGNDTMLLNGGSGSFYGDEGDDLIIADGMIGSWGYSINLYGGDGSDTMVIKNGEYVNAHKKGTGELKLWHQQGSNNTITGDEGDDLIYISGGKDLTANTSAGTDKVYIDGIEEGWNSESLKLFLDDGSVEKDYLNINMNTMNGKIFVGSHIDPGTTVKKADRDSVMLVGEQISDNIRFQLDGSSLLVHYYNNSAYNTKKTITFSMKNSNFIGNLCLQEQSQVFANTCTSIDMGNLLKELQSFGSKACSLSDISHQDNVLVEEPFTMQALLKVGNAFPSDK